MTDSAPLAPSLAPGLWLVSTPIGAARDITLRALDVLGAAEVLAAEDTRSLRHLMQIHGLSAGGRTLLAYHDHNGERMRPKLLAALAEGRSVAYASEAGTPLVADPGFQLVRAAVAAGHAVHAVPGASAVLAALAVAGLPTDRFAFLGFAPAQAGARARFLAEAAAIPATCVLYESPRRVARLLAEMVPIFGAGRDAVVCRELTKRHEEVIRAPLGDLAAALASREIKGEVVVLTDRQGAVAVGAGTLEAALADALAQDSLRAAVDRVAAELGLPRRQVYQAALALQKGQGDE
ncbi:16S rRNA (cytidine(1402)-2'-O)-methyltransferase [Pararhodobacter sp. SW119]|uniref:16S rRNA (cytidine(1402)-2'-O)-methyltransferase n=1 Tax=Pararhodobacter sp. SW119 TaxID=2780075 RepID=UPI001FD87246|nr:16S rRNA (cytidine(1402)-2'-O)-methyltransferase [Pararhodobacter sp. SW119]